MPGTLHTLPLILLVTTQAKDYYIHFGDTRLEAQRIITPGLIAAKRKT